MAIYHLSIKIISSGKGQSAIAAASYRSASRLKNEKTGEIKDFTKKQGVVYSEIQLPTNAPKDYLDREKLWNAVQNAERQRNAQYAREIEVALCKEFDRVTQKNVLHSYIEQEFVKKGMIADWSIHDKGDENPHAHIMLTMRSLKKDGTWAPKKKSSYALNKKGERIPQIDSKTGKQKIGERGRKMWKRTTIAYNDWNNKENVEIWRMNWSKLCNTYLSKEKQLDHRSYKRQGKEQIPTIHEGYVARKIERNGKISDRVEINRKINVVNKDIQTFKQLLNISRNLKILLTLKKYLEKLKERVTRAIMQIIRDKKQIRQQLEDRLNEQIREQYERLNDQEKEFGRQTSSISRELESSKSKFDVSNTAITNSITRNKINEREIELRKQEIERANTKAIERRKLSKGGENAKECSTKSRRSKSNINFNRSKGPNR